MTALLITALVAAIIIIGTFVISILEHRKPITAEDIRQMEIEAKRVVSLADARGPAATERFRASSHLVSENNR